MIRMNIELFKNIKYLCKAKTFPLVIKFTSDMSEKVGNRFSLSHITILNIKDDQMGFGYFQTCGLSTPPDQEIQLSRAEPFFLFYDALAFGNVNGLKKPEQGNYNISARISYLQKNIDGEYKEYEIEASNSIFLYDDLID